MGEVPTEMPDSDRSGASLQDSGSRSLSEEDLRLIHALQIDPRAAWSRIGQALGIDATTAARRWQRLSADGLAWTTAYTSTTTQVAYIWLRCAPSALPAVCDQVCRDPYVFGVDRLDGEWDLLLCVAVDEMSDLDDVVLTRLRSTPGLQAVRSAVATRMYFDGSNLRAQALEPTASAVLAGARDRPAPAGRGLRDEDAGLILALGADARVPASRLAASARKSEATVRRRIEALRRAGVLVLRCDFAHPLAGWRTNVTVRAQLPAGRLDALASTLQTWPQIRMCVATAGGRSNLLLMGMLRRPEDLIALEAKLGSTFTDLRVTERSIILRSLKRMGRLLDAEGRAIGMVPLGAAGRPPAPA
ncbi:MAG: Lrp/AsnC family transcriptional regulator [Nocardioidaceae bacterium]|nr:Lrp/AsnC family transcriptional regulator [Nocardioidaceae bacterium]MCL2611601.1 Lrp/AsnC family transcriptional regulator [Nocardioidaceae bacterium]